MDWMDEMAQAGGDVTRSAIADIGDTYQEVLMQDASISPPDGLTGVMETTTDLLPEQTAMTDAQLQSLVDVQQHEAAMEAQAMAEPEPISAPDAPEMG